MFKVVGFKERFSRMKQEWMRLRFGDLPAGMALRMQKGSNSAVIGLALEIGQILDRSRQDWKEHW